MLRGSPWLDSLPPAFARVLLESPGITRARLAGLGTKFGVWTEDVNKDGRWNEHEMDGLLDSAQSRLDSMTIDDQRRCSYSCGATRSWTSA